MADEFSPKQSTPIRARRWSRPSSSSGGRPRPYRLALRLVGIPAAAVAGVLIYRGVHDRFVLPECDSSRAKQTLSGVLKQLEVAPLRDEAIKTVSSGKDRVVCNVVLPLSDGGHLNIDYDFFWQGDTAQMKYSISRQPAQNSSRQPVGN